MQPSQALDIHAALTEVVGDPQEGGMPDILRILALEEGHIAVPASEKLYGSRADPVSAIHDHLRFGYTFHVAASATEIYHQAERRMPETLRISDVPPPTPSGVMVLDDPIPDHHDNPSIHAISWGPTQLAYYEDGDDPEVMEPRSENGVLAVLWNDANRDERYFNKLTSSEMLGDYATPSAKATAKRRLFSISAGFLPVSFVPMYQSNNLTIPDSRVALDKDAPAAVYQASRVAALVRVICAIWQLMDQTIPNPRSYTEEPHIRRTFALRARKAGLPPRVTVVKLRRYSESEETGSGKPLDHRIPVRPHTRHYWVRNSDTGEMERVKKNIALHWRGPEDAPIVVTDKVYSLQR